MTPPLFDLRGVHYAYQGLPALEGLDLTLPAGSRTVLLGANGSGKSTLLKLLDALYFADAGEVLAFGEPLTEARLGDAALQLAFRRRVGLVFQNPDVQLFNPTVFDEIAFGPLQLGWPKKQILAAVDTMLERFDIAPLRDRPPHRLSGGEKKRVALASVLVLDPEVLLLDEPTAALDPESQNAVIEFLAEPRGDGRTIITATHDLEIVEAIADHAVVLDRGKVAAAGEPAAILSDGPLLRRSRLIHAHWHRHDDGTTHAHPHRHR